MNTRLGSAWLLACIGMIAIPSRGQAQARGTAAGGSSDMRVYAGGRYHAESTVLPFLPYDKGDLSATLGVEFQEGSGYWQILLNGMENPGSGAASADRILTPQINLLFRDRNVLAGSGILRSYIRDADTGGRWSSFYFQLKMGLEFQLAARFDLTVFAAYPFKRWENMTDFRGTDLEYTAGLSFRF